MESVQFNFFYISIVFILLFLFFGCKEEDVEPETCSIELSNPIPTIPKLGISPTFKGDFNDWNTSEFIESIELISNLGADVVHYGFLWSELQPGEEEFEWNFTDEVINAIEQNGEKISIIVPVINTSDADDLPEHVSFSTFTDGNLIPAYTEFILAFLNRYGDKIDYLYIGNEIDVYFSENTSEITAYKTFFQQVNDAIEVNYPNVNVGVTFTYHDALNNGTTEIYREFSEADILGFTLYSQFLGSNPNDFTDHLNGLINLTENIGIPIAITETTWSSAGYSGSVENQKLFIKTALDAFKEQSGNLEYFTFWGTYDFPQSFIELSMITDPEFGSWLSSLSFITNQGIPKESYCTFIDELRDF